MTSAQRHTAATRPATTDGGLGGDDGDRRQGPIKARRKLSAGPLYRPAVRMPLPEGAMAKTAEARRRGAESLSAALLERRRSVERYEAATGRPGHLVAEVAVHAADQEVAAREAWLRWVDDERCHGLNAGPFELFAQDSRAVYHQTPV